MNRSSCSIALLGGLWSREISTLQHGRAEGGSAGSWKVLGFTISSAITRTFDSSLASL